MSDKAEKKPEAAAPAAGEKKDAKKAGGLLAQTPVLLGIVMVLEAVILFAGFKFLGGGPKPANAVDFAQDDSGHGDHDGGGHGDGGHGEGGGANKKASDKDRLVELNVVDIKAPNTQNGRRFIYDMSVYASVKGEFEAKVKERIKDRDALIKDRMRTIIGQIDPEKLGGGSEPGLETLRRQIKTQLEIIIGDGMIDEVLVPRCIPFRADF